jgi:hypothetical protein
MFSQLCSPWQLSRRQPPARTIITITTTTTTTDEIGPLTGAFFQPIRRLRGDLDRGQATLGY